MNTEDIIRWAREALLGSSLTHDERGLRIWIEGADWHDEITRFAALAYEAGAAAAKQEMLEAGNDKWLEEARRQEREACAKVAETTAKFSAYAVGESVQDYIAAAIRARKDNV
jgi:hypothetical protein